MPKNSQKGIAPILIILLAAIGLIAFLLLTNTASFKDRLFGQLYPKPASKATGIVDLSLAPAQITTTKDTPFNLDITMDTKTEQVSAAEIKVNYDPTKLQATAVSAGSLLPVVLVPGAISGGTAMITLGASPESPVSGAGVLATITFKAIVQNASTTVSFDSTMTQAAAIGKDENVLGNLNPAQVTVSRSKGGGKPTKPR